MDISQIIDQYCKKGEDIINNIIKKNEEYNIKLYKANNTNIIEFNSNNKLLLKATYDSIGLYSTINSCWYWAYAIPFSDKSIIEKSKQVIKFGEDIIKNFDKFNPKQVDIYHYYCSNQMFYANQDIVKTVSKLGNYAMNGVMYFPINHNHDQIQIGGYNNDQIQIGSGHNNYNIEYITIYNVLQL